jgi:hypothetical protein
MGGAYSTHGIIECILFLVGRAEVSLVRPRCRWDDNIRMDLREIGWEGVDLILLAQVRDLGGLL